MFLLLEEEIDDLAGQVQLLEQSRIKLEMSMAAMKKEHRRELSIKVRKILLNFHATHINQRPISEIVIYISRVVL